MYLDSNNELVPNSLEPPQKKTIKEILKTGYKPKTKQASPKELNTIGLNNQAYEQELVPKRKEMELWAQMQRKRIQDRYKSDFLQKYGFLISQGFAVVLIIGITLIVMNKQVEIAETLQQGYNSAITVLQAIKGV